MRSIFRAPSIKRKIMASTTAKYKRQIKKSLLPYYGEKGTGVYKDPKKALYNELYNKSSIGQKEFEKLTNQENISSNNQVNNEELPWPPEVYGVLGFVFIALGIILLILTIILFFEKRESFSFVYVLIIALSFFAGHIGIKSAK